MCGATGAKLKGRKVKRKEESRWRGLPPAKKLPSVADSFGARRKASITVRAAEVDKLVDWLERLAVIYDTLGFPEESAPIRMEIAIVKKKLSTP